MSLDTTLTFHDSTIQNFLHSPTGPVSRQVHLRAERVLDRARENVGTLFNNRTGALLASIDIQSGHGLEGPTADVGSSLRTRDGKYSVGTLLEVGTVPHSIRAVNARVLASGPDNPDPLLFPRRSVNHPGSPARPWLVPALESVFR